MKAPVITRLLAGAVLLAVSAVAQVPYELNPLGCWTIEESQFPDGATFPLPGENSPPSCGQVCYDNGFTYFALSFQFCRCANILEATLILDPGSCNIACVAPWEDQFCGGQSDTLEPYYNVWTIEIPSSTTSTDTVPPPTTTPDPDPSTTPVPTTAETTTEPPPPSSTVEDPSTSTSTPTSTTSTDSSTSPTSTSTSTSTEVTSITEVVTSTSTGTTCVAGVCSATTTTVTQCPGGCAVFVKIIYVEKIVLCPDGSPTVTLTPTVTTIYYDASCSTTTTTIVDGTSCVILVPITRAAVVTATTINGTRPTVYPIIAAAPPRVGGTGTGVAVLCWIGAFLGGALFLL